MKRLPARGRLWHNREFLRLWAGQTASQAGSRVTDLALPMTAILVLDASAGQVGILVAAEFAPSLVVTLAAGVWADRHRRRPILVGANLGRAAVLALVPILALTGGLSMAVLYAVALSAGILTTLFDVTYISYIPTLVQREDLVEANSKMQSSQSVAEVGGFGAGGVLTQLLTAPGAVLVDAVSYLVAAASLLSIRHREPEPRAPAQRRSVPREASEGLRFTLGSSVLRPVMLQSAAYNLFNAVVLVVLPVYALRQLHMSPATLGLVIASGSTGAVAGAMAAARVGRRLRPGPTMALGMGLAWAGFLLLSLVGGRYELVIAQLIAAHCLLGAGLALFNVQALSIRQRIVPHDMMGRVTASYRLVSRAMIPAGSLLGGFSAELLGPRATLVGAAIGLGIGAALFAASRGARTDTIGGLALADAPSAAA
jgi:MFS family permease